MWNYKWQGLDTSGKKTSGNNYAASFAQLKNDLKKSKIYLLHARIDFTATIRACYKLKTKHITHLITQLAILINAYVPLLQALTIMEQEIMHLQLRKLIIDCRNSIIAGKSLYQTCMQYPHYFTEIMCSMINAGEQSGTLDIMLDELAQHLQQRAAQKRRLFQALLYPTLLLGVALVTCGILLLVVVPQFATMFYNFGATLPYYTQCIIALSNWLQYSWLWLCLGGMGIIANIKIACKRYKTVRRFYNELPLILPLCKNIYLNNIYYRLSQTLSLTIKAGVPLLQALNLASATLSVERYQHALTQTSSLIANGKSLHEALVEQHLFPAKMLQLISLGEETGSLEKIFMRIATLYRDELNHRLQNLNNLLEPIIIIVLSLLVGGLVIGIYLPIMNLGMVM